jgi:hypothetical protein
MIVLKDTLRGKDEQHRLPSPRAFVITSPRHCSGILSENCPRVQVVSAEAGAEQKAKTLYNTTDVQPQFG